MADQPYQFFALTDEPLSQTSCVRSYGSHATCLDPNIMKTPLWTLLLVAQLGAIGAQSGSDVTRVIPPGSAPDVLRFAVTERGPHHRTWERVEQVPGPDGRLVERRHVYQELATGLHFQNERGGVGGSGGAD